MKDQISSWLRDYLESNGMGCFVIGVSGGVDSAVTSTLCAMTGRKTIVVSLPIHQAEDQLQRANNHIEWLKNTFPNVKPVSVDMSACFQVFASCFPDASDLSLANSRSRLRMTALYQIASSNNGIVVGTGNKVEDFGVGFYTKYGDGGVDISPLADLMKSEVWTLAQELGVSNDIIDAPPTDGLWSDGRTDEDQIGVSYTDLEWAMHFSGDESQLDNNRKKVLYRYKLLNAQNQHKMNPIPIFKR